MLDGLELLGWLVRIETSHGSFSFTPAIVGRGPGEHGPSFDQQPIEGAAMADACYRAWTASGDERWAEWCIRSAEWFLGRNDIGLALYDEQTGGSADGLLATGVSPNWGAESTIAALTALQRGRSAASALGSVRARNRVREQRVEKRQLIDHASANAAVGSSVDEVDRSVVAPVDALNEHDVVDITEELPSELGHHDWVGEHGANPPGRGVEQSDHHRVNTAGVAFVEEQEQPFIGLESRSPGTDSERPSSGPDDHVIFEVS
jgi:hypothetical protein